MRYGAIIACVHNCCNEGCVESSRLLSNVEMNIERYTVLLNLPCTTKDIPLYYVELL